MSGEGAFYLVAVSGGTVVDKQQAGLKDKNASGSKSQHWTVEYGNDPTQIAFQNADNGQWLRAFSGAAYGKIDTGEKQWWTLSDGPSPGSKWIKCNDFPDAYLCNANGSYIDNNQVYAWPKQLNWTHALTWHMKDAKAPGFTPKEWKAASPNENTEELKKKEAQLAEREQTLKEIEAREAAVAENERKAKDLDGREAALAEKEKSVKDLEGKEKSLSAREQELAAKEAAQKKQADQLAAQEKDLASKAGQSTPKSNDNAAEQAALQKKLDELKAAERDLAAREAAASRKEQLASAKDKELKAKQAELERKLREASKNGANAEALLKAENDNLKLQLKLKDLEKELEAAKRVSATGPGANKPDDDKQLQRLKDENARLKKLVAQQVLKKPSKPSASGAVNGDHTTPKASTSAPSASNQPIDSGKPTANTGRPVVSPHKVGGYPSPKPGSQAAGKNEVGAPKPSGASGEDPELAKLKEENARLKQQIADAKKPGNAGKPTGRPATEDGVSDSWLRPATLTPNKSTGIQSGKPSTKKPAAELASGGKGGSKPASGGLAPGGKGDPKDFVNGNNQPTSNTASSTGKPSAKAPASGLASGGKGVSKPSSGGLAPGGKGDPKDFGNDQPTSNVASTSGKPASKPVSNGTKKPAAASTRPGQTPSSGGASKTPSKSGTGTPTVGTGPTGEQEPVPHKYDCGHVVYPPPRKVGMRAVGYVYE